MQTRIKISDQISGKSKRQYYQNELSQLASLQGWYCDNEEVIVNTLPAQSIKGVIEFYTQKGNINEGLLEHVEIVQL